jgi:pimeloyl-ACP methyl ester carboxylesterase
MCEIQNSKFKIHNSVTLFPFREVDMKHAAMLSLIIVVLACGGAPQTGIPVPEEPMAAPPVAGTVAAPDGVSIAYTIRANESPALVFIHGWMCDQTFWDAQVEPMSESFTVVTIDLPGHGLSGMEREGWPLMAFGADVQTVVEHLDLDQVILVGHSMGGPVALEAARLMPNRVLGVVAVDALHNADFEYGPEQKAGFLAAWNQDFAGTCTTFVTSMFPETADPALVDRVEASMCEGPAQSSVAQLRQFLDYDMKAALVAVQVPVRCINASQFPTDIEGNRAYHEDFDAIIIDGPGHFLMMETPEQFNAHLGLIVAEMSETP